MWGSADFRFILIEGEFMENFLENEENFGALLPFIVDDSITDVDWNGRQLWLTTNTN